MNGDPVNGQAQSPGPSSSFFDRHPDAAAASGAGDIDRAGKVLLLGCLTGMATLALVTALVLVRLLIEARP